MPFVYGEGERSGGGSASSPSSGSGPTCTLGQLVAAISGRKDGAGAGDGSSGAAVGYNADTPVRPLRARISALTNTVKEGEMPTVVAVAGFSPAAEAIPIPSAAAGGGGGEGKRDEDEKDANVTAAEDGAVRGRGKWGVMGGYHLRWEFETMNLDLGGDKIVRAGGAGGEGGRDLYEFFLDQNLLILAWKDAPKKEDAIVFVRDEVPR